MRRANRATGLLTGHGDGRLPRWLVALPYVVGILHLVAFNILFRLFRGTLIGRDSGEFLRIADALRSGAWWTNPNNSKPLGYPLLLALSAHLPGDSVTNALLWNAGFCLWTIFVVGRITRLLNGSPAAILVAQTIFALVPNTAAWANLVLSDTMAMALFVSSLLVFLKMIAGPGGEMRVRHAMLLGALLGGLALTRSEYVLLFPIVTCVLCGVCLSRRFPVRCLLKQVVVLWLCGLPMLIIQPTVSGWRGTASFIPPSQVQVPWLDLWRSWYDVELTQLRFHRLDELAQRATSVPGRDLPLVNADLQTLKYAAAGEAAVDDRLLKRVGTDLHTLRHLVMTQHVSLSAAYRQLACTLVWQDPRGYTARVMKRLFLYLTAADLDWPHAHPAHWLYTVLLRPLSSVAYLCLVAIVAVDRGSLRETTLIVGLWAAFPILVHSMFIFEQRFLYPSIPLLCVIGAQAIRAFTLRRRPV